MNTRILPGVPVGYIGIGDAFEKAFLRLEPARQLLDAVSVEKWIQIPGELHYFRPDPQAQRALEKAEERVELRIRQAIASGELDVFYTDPRTGQPMICVDRDGWLQPSFAGSVS